MKALGNFLDEIENDDTIKNIIQIELHTKKHEELINLIEKIGRHYHEDELFLKEYTDDIISLWSHDLDKALTCFRDLAKQIDPINKWK